MELNQAKTDHSSSPVVDDRYEFIEEIARGGAAVVWRVRDRHLGRETAVKYLRDSQDNREMRTRLEREARLCARLVHPGIVPIHELSSFADGRPFVSMKLVEGKTLLQLLESEPRPSLKSMIEIFAKVCQSMAYAHDKGIIHRDLKPGNIMVGLFGEVQIMDWGLAKDLNDKSDLAPITIDSRDEPSLNPTIQDGDADSTKSESTIAGSIFGTIAYMSPEQANGKIALIDKSSDVFSLGAVLYRLLTGIPPYQDLDKHLDQTAMLRRAQRGELSQAFERLARAKPHKLAALAQRCMAIEPSMRPANAGEVAAELAAIRNAEQRTTHTLRFLVVATSIVVTIACSILWTSRLSKHDALSSIAPPSATAVAPQSEQQPPPQAVPPSALPTVPLDLESIKALLNSERRSIVLDNYRKILDHSPSDQELHFVVAMALMNCERFREGEEVSRDLISMDPEKADYLFMLSESLFWQGRYEASKEVMLHSKDLRDKGSHAAYPIEESLARLEKYMDIVKQVSSASPPTFESLDADALIEAGEACSLLNKVDFAKSFCTRGLDKIMDARQLTIKRHDVLMRFIRRILRRHEVTDEVRNSLADWCVDLLQKQLEDVPVLLRPPYSNPQLLKVLKSSQFDFARQLADDSRVKEDVRNRMTKVLLEIQETSE